MRQAASKTKLLTEKRKRKYFIVSLTTFSCVIQHSIAKQMLWSKSYQLLLFPEGTVWEHKPLLLLTKSLRWTSRISVLFIVMSCYHENECFQFMLRALSALHLLRPVCNNVNYPVTVEIEVAKWGKQLHLGNKKKWSPLYISSLVLTVSWYKGDIFAENRRALVPLPLAPPSSIWPSRLNKPNFYSVQRDVRCDYNTEQTTILATVVKTFSPTLLRPP